MILQFKVTLKGMKPPIWRRIQVHSNSTFHDLHQILQIAFDWTDTHLHDFDLKKTNSVQIELPLTIGINDEEGLFAENDYDERIEKLQDWFVAEKDRCIYTYDFGDNWQHEIVLEKILPVEPGVHYPRCLKVMRGTPNEDSRGSGEEIEPIDNEEELEYINEEFRHLSSEEEENDDGASWSKLLSLAEEFKQLQPWRWMDDNQLFAVIDPIENDNMYCSVMGAGGMEYGLAVYIGMEGLEFINKLYADDIDEQTYLEQRSIFFSLSDRKELDPADYQLLKDHGRSYRGKKQWPLFRSFTPGYYPWQLDQEEVRILSVVLEQALVICKSVLHDPSILDAEPGYFFARSIDLDTGDWESCYIPEVYNKETKDVPLLISELELKSVSKLKGKYPVPLEFDASPGPIPVQDQPRMRPYYPIFIFCAEKMHGLIIHHDTTGPTDADEQIQRSFIHLIKNLGAIPKEIFIKEEMYPILQPIASTLNIDLIPSTRLPLLDEARIEMNDLLR